MIRMWISNLISFFLINKFSNLLKVLAVWTPTSDAVVLVVYEVPISTVEKLERIVTGYIKKWLGVPWCLTYIGLHGDSVLRLPLTSLTEEFKCAKARLQMTLTESRDTVVSDVRAMCPVLHASNPQRHPHRMPNQSHPGVLYMATQPSSEGPCIHSGGQTSCH